MNFILLCSTRVIRKSNKDTKCCAGAVDNMRHKLLSPPLLRSKSSRENATDGIKWPREPCSVSAGYGGVGAGQVLGLGLGWLEGCCREGDPEHGLEGHTECP